MILPSTPAFPETSVSPERASEDAREHLLSLDDMQITQEQSIQLLFLDEISYKLKLYGRFLAEPGATDEFTRTGDVASGFVKAWDRGELHLEQTFPRMSMMLKDLGIPAFDDGGWTQPFWQIAIATILHHRASAILDAAMMSEDAASSRGKPGDKPDGPVILSFKPATAAAISAVIRETSA